MAPEWALASRPLVLVFMAVAIFVTIAFRADVDAQGGAYATGVLVLMTSAGVAVVISLWKRRRRFAYMVIAAIFVYTTAVNIFERPEGLKISSFFILTMIMVSLVSRAIAFNRVTHHLNRIHSRRGGDAGCRRRSDNPFDRAQTAGRDRGGLGQNRTSRAAAIRTGRKRAHVFFLRLKKATRPSSTAR